jgi:DtxR family transcriptional regulator, Mn-dependent transcriptional regulator
LAYLYWELVSRNMVNPAVALGLFALLLVIAAVVFWPRIGLAARAGRMLRMTERVRLEDALKHLYHCEAASLVPTVESLAGAMEVGRGVVPGVIGRLAELELARVGGPITLTDAGRAYALRIIRTHRLWERYLADRTGVAPTEWHELAESQEHALTAVQAEALASRMGHPLYDPHGDPIPTVTGELPARLGQPLTSLLPDTPATIVHLEDEPREVFDRLLAEGLTPGTSIRLIEANPREVRFRAEGRDHVLAPMVAANITVELLPREAQPDERRWRSLADLAPGESAPVVRLSPGLQGPERRRLLDLGVVPGTVVTAEFASASGDPVAYRIRGALIALRRTQAERVRIDPPAVEAAS